jgi:hypothetical protein
MSVIETPDKYQCDWPRYKVVENKLLEYCLWPMGFWRWLLGNIPILVFLAHMGPVDSCYFCRQHEKVIRSMFHYGEN